LNLFEMKLVHLKLAYEKSVRVRQTDHVSRATTAQFLYDFRYLKGWAPFQSFDLSLRSSTLSPNSELSREGKNRGFKNESGASNQ
jgi:hypothetical protein